MRAHVWAGLALPVLVAALASAQPAGAAAGKVSAVFVQTNELSGNRIVVYDRQAEGTLVPAGVYETGGRGGAAAPGTESDHLASQGSLVYDGGRLFAVNAGSDTVSMFSVVGDRLRLADVVPSGGQFPNSIAVHGRLVYVLNAGGSANVTGFRLGDDKLHRLQGSRRSLGIQNSDPPNFLTAPGQVGFAPGGGKLIVTTKASGSTIDVFSVRPDGRLSSAPVANPSATPVPFAFTFAPSGRLVSGEAGVSALTTYALGQDGSLSDPKSLTDGQVALCWVTPAEGFYYVSNTGSDNVSAYRVGADGQPSLATATGVVAETDPGPIDSAATAGFLYVETGGTATVDEFEIAGDGTLTQIGSVAGLPTGSEGIAVK
jgi:6-phosphogluconolactonase (cycloisomerase 2 family)